MLLARYHRAIELADQKLAAFYGAMQAAGCLDDTLLVITSDHGESFGEHGLYFHDASVYNMRLHVPLWIRHTSLRPGTVDDVVSTRSLFDLLRAVGVGERLDGTILDEAARKTCTVALAEHFHYPYTDGLLSEYTDNIATTIAGRHKMIVRRCGPQYYDLERDPEERAPVPMAIADFAAIWDDGLPGGAISAATEHLRTWETAMARRVDDTTSAEPALPSRCRPFGPTRVVELRP